jgi:uncharacterized coiled-coil DUF342 family protein
LQRFNQNERQLKQKCEQARTQLAETEQQETTIRDELDELRRQVRDNVDTYDAHRWHVQSIVRQYTAVREQIWQCLSSDHGNIDCDDKQLVEQVRKQLNASRTELKHQENVHRSANGQLHKSMKKFIDILVGRVEPMDCRTSTIVVRY